MTSMLFTLKLFFLRNKEDTINLSIRIINELKSTCYKAFGLEILPDLTIQAQKG